MVRAAAWMWSLWLGRRPRRWLGARDHQLYQEWRHLGPGLGNLQPARGLLHQTNNSKGEFSSLMDAKTGNPLKSQNVLKVISSVDAWCLCWKSCPRSLWHLVWGLWAVASPKLLHRSVRILGGLQVRWTSGNCEGCKEASGIFIFRNDNEQTRWLPTNIKHVSEVSRYDDQVNRYTGDTIIKGYFSEFPLIQDIRIQVFWWSSQTQLQWAQL